MGAKSIVNAILDQTEHVDAMKRVVNDSPRRTNPSRCRSNVASSIRGRSVWYSGNPEPRGHGQRELDHRTTADPPRERVATVDGWAGGRRPRRAVSARRASIRRPSRRTGLGTATRHSDSRHRPGGDKAPAGRPVRGAGIPERAPQRLPRSVPSSGRAPRGCVASARRRSLACDRCRGSRPRVRRRRSVDSRSSRRHAAGQDEERRPNAVPRERLEQPIEPAV